MKFSQASEITRQSLIKLLTGTAIVGLISPAANLRFSIAINTPKDDWKAESLFRAGLSASLITSSIILIVSILAYSIVSRANPNNLFTYILFISLGVYGASILDVYQSRAVRNRFFSHISRARIAQTGTGQCFQLAIGLVGAGLLGLIIGEILGKLASIVTFSRGKVKEFARASSDFINMREQIKTFSRFPKYAVPASIVNSVSLHAPVLLLGALYSLPAVGAYIIAYRIFAMPLSFIGAGASQIFISNVSGKGQMRHSPHGYFLWFSARLLLLGGLPVLILALAAPFYFTTIFGGQWEVSVGIAQALAILISAQLVVTPLSQILNVLDYQRDLLKWDVSRLLIIVTVFMLAYILNYNLLFTVLLYSLAMTLMYAVLWILIYIRLRTERKDYSYNDVNN